MLALEGDLLSYYRGVLPLICASFEGVPLVWNTYPKPKDPPVWHGPLRDRVHTLPTVEVPLAHGRVVAYFAFVEHTAEWLVTRHRAVEFHSWTPLPSNPQAMRYARILLETGDVDRGPQAASVRDAAVALRGLLNERGVEAIPLLDGSGGVALYLPFCDAPSYTDVRQWLHSVANDAAMRYPDLFTTEPNSAGGSRVHVHVKNNAPGLYSALPYSLRGPQGRCAVAPVTWDEFATLPARRLEIETAALPERIRVHGDLFAAQSAALASQRFAGVARVPGAAVAAAAAVAEPRGRVLHAALDILADGRSRTAEELLKEGVARGLLPASTSYRYVYNALVQYIDRNVARSRKAAIVQNTDRSFRINEPLDDWPGVELPPAPPVDDATQALVQRLQATVSGSDPAAWETAVCDAFAHLGFRATHLGGHKAPDGYVDAELGALGYRAMLECKTGAGIVPRPDVAEAAKWADGYNGQFCTIVGPGFPDETEFYNELLTHRVSAWTIDDLLTALAQRLDPLELKACFAPGYAADAMLDALWERGHGERKRVSFAAETICRAGWAVQAAAALQADPADAAHLTIDAAMLLVADELTRAGATRACTRDEVRLAFEYLTSPIVGRASWLDDARDAVVIRSAPAGAKVPTALNRKQVHG